MSRIQAVKLFTGAPDAKGLRWANEDLTVPLLPCFATDTPLGKTLPPTSSHSKPVWRSIPLHQNLLPTGYSQFLERQYLQHAEDDTSFDAEETSFLDTRELSFLSSSASDNECPISADAADILTQFYEQSFAAREEIPSSQIVGLQSSSETSFISTASDLSSSYLGPSAEDIRSTQRPIPISGPLASLKDIPNAAYLRSINPQTMTVNLIVGIISLPQPRTIRSRKWGRTLELIEMIVADDTKAGFGINLWLPSGDPLPGSLKAIADTLRPQDVILLRNVALDSFRNNVNGQSLRKDLTKLDLMYRNVIDKHDERGVYGLQDLEDAAAMDAQARKVKDVKDWVMQFVSGGPKDGNLRRTRATGLVAELTVLPPDTQ
ncbi:hypothetical protein MMC30_007368 [Trapelia coarctata]|nr:hypothetical protein [Trapelia coarctata]